MDEGEEELENKRHEHFILLSTIVTKRIIHYFFRHLKRRLNQLPVEDPFNKLMKHLESLENILWDKYEIINSAKKIRQLHEQVEAVLTKEDEISFYLLLLKLRVFLQECIPDQAMNSVFDFLESANNLLNQIHSLCAKRFHTTKKALPYIEATERQVRAHALKQQDAMLTFLIGFYKDNVEDANQTDEFYISKDLGDNEAALKLLDEFAKYRQNLTFSPLFQAILCEGLPQELILRSYQQAEMECIRRKSLQQQAALFINCFWDNLHSEYIHIFRTTEILTRRNKGIPNIVHAIRTNIMRTDYVVPSIYINLLLEQYDISSEYFFQKLSQGPCFTEQENLIGQLEVMMDPDFLYDQKGHYVEIRKLLNEAEGDENIASLKSALSVSSSIINCYSSLQTEIPTLMGIDYSIEPPELFGFKWWISMQAKQINFYLTPSKLVTVYSLYKRSITLSASWSITPAAIRVAAEYEFAVDQDTTIPSEHSLRLVDWEKEPMMCWMNQSDQPTAQFCMKESDGASVLVHFINYLEKEDSCKFPYKEEDTMADLKKTVLANLSLKDNQNIYEFMNAGVLVAPELKVSSLADSTGLLFQKKSIHD